MYLLYYTFWKGDAVSLPLGDVNKRLRNIISLGYKEVTFTGIDLTHMEVIFLANLILEI